MALTSKGIKLSYKASGGSGTFTALTNLQEIPELGGEVEAIEITTLEDDAHVYTDGLINYGDNLAFKFLMGDDMTQFTTLSNLEGIQEWKVDLPKEAGSCTFSGSCSVKLDGVAIGGAITYTLSIKPSSAMVWA